MTFTDKYIIDTYAQLFEGLNPLSKIVLIEKLTKSLKKGKDSSDIEFFRSFGAFDSDKSADELIKELKENRKFRKKDLKF